MTEKEKIDSIGKLVAVTTIATIAILVMTTISFFESRSK